MTSETANGGESGQAATPGDVLRARREQQGMSVDDVASYLRLSPRQVQALEANDFDALPGLTFVRGFIRNYARLLHLDPQPLLALAPELNPLVQAKPITTASERIRYREQQPVFGDKRPGKRKKPVLIGIMVLVIAVVAIAFALRHRHAVSQNAPVASAPAVTTTPAPAAAPSTTENAPMLPMPPNATPAAPPANEPSAAPMLPTPAAPAAPAQPTPVQPAPTAAQAPASGAGRLRVTTRAAAWVKITDAQGKTILARLLPAGANEAIVGVPPLQVTVGNAPSVQMIYNDKPVDLASHVSGQVAHLTLE